MQQAQRNDPCPCGSGKKYKKCCMNAAQGSSLITKNRYVYAALVVIFVLSIILRYWGFQQPHGLTFDEGLYAELIAEQLKEDPLNYSTQTAYQIQTARGVKVPEYLDRPLFKHPPLYNYFIALNYKLFGSSHLAAVSVSILFGSLMVLVVFLLGRELFDHRVGLLAAFFVCIDPVHWICSEKIWMETTMVFFMLLAVYFFALGQKQKHYLAWSGVSIGLAMLTKYPGVVALFIIAIFAMFFNRSLFKQKGFWVLCGLSLLVFAPWIIWNWSVYGNMFSPLLSVHSLGGTIERSIQSLSKDKWLFAGVLILAGLFIPLRRKMSFKVGAEAATSKQKRILGVVCFALFILALIIVPFLRAIAREAFVWKDTVMTGWSNPFSRGPWHFYLTRLCELSPLYIFSFLSVFLFLGKNRGDQLLLLSSLWILGAFILLGNYQSRYILPAVPFLLILSARFQVLVYDKLSLSSDQGTEEGHSNSGSYQGLLKVIFIITTVYFILKTLRTDWLIAIGPDFGYF